MRTCDRIHEEQLPSTEEIKHIAYSDTPYKMKPGDHVIYADSTLGAIDIYLPPKHLAVGKFYFIKSPAAATADVSILDRELKTEIATYGDHDANDDHVLFYCSGQAWLMVFDGVA